MTPDAVGANAPVAYGGDIVYLSSVISEESPDPENSVMMILLSRVRVL